MTKYSSSPLVALDGIIFSLQRHGGITVYFRELLAQVVASGIAARLTLDLPVIQDLTDLPGAQLAERRSARIGERFRHCRLPSGTRVFHSSYYRRPAQLDVPTVVTVHDFIYERFRRGPPKWVHMAQKHAAIRHAQALICISESTRDDLLEWVGVRSDQTVHVIPNGVSEVFRPLAGAVAVRPFVLFVGERRGYKNFALALATMAFLPEIELHCVGGGPLRDEEFAGCNASVRARVRHLGFVSDEALNTVYNHALCLFYPSRYEGFGIPVVEAMRAGCPVVCIDCKAVIEVGGDALERAEVEDPAALADAVQRIQDSENRQKRIAAGIERASTFDWRRCHEQTLQVYRQLAAG